MFKDCYAYYSATDGSVHLGNGKIEKIMKIKGSFIRTHSVRDCKNGYEWSGGRSLWQRCPLLDACESPILDFKTEVVENSFVMKAHLKAEIVFSGRHGTVWYEYLIFPDVSFIYNQIYISKQDNAEIFEERKQSNNPTGIEKQQNTVSDQDVFCSSDTLDCIPLGQRHVNVESFKLYDKTDYNDMLVERQNASVYIFKNGNLSREGNVFCVNDYTSENSIMLVKHSPTESSALNRKGKDFDMQGSIYATLYGTGIDFTDIPDGKVPYYASAVGVGKTQDIYEEYWRYNTAFCLDDPRKSLYIMSNTWGDRSQDTAVCERFMLKELDRAKELGVDIVQIDDGWQSGITANSGCKSGGVWEGYYADNSDFWQVNNQRFPNGLEPIVSKAKSYGIEIGLWFSPDSSKDFENVDRDIETLLDLYNKYGIRYFKLDGVKIRNKLCEMRFIHLISELNRRTNGDMRFNLDVTAEDRFGYLYQPQFGTVFVENRYTDYVNYFPHNTFKNVWNLARVIPTRRLQMEILNIRRNTDRYNGYLFAPNTYSLDYLFATVMVANPLFWMEMTNLADDDAKLLAEISGIYKNYKAELFESRVIPIGKMPNGMAFSGYYCQNADKKSENVILFREATKDHTHTFKLPADVAGKNMKIIYQNAPTDVKINGDSITVEFAKQISFVWLRFD